MNEKSIAELIAELKEAAENRPHEEDIYAEYRPQRQQPLFRFPISRCYFPLQIQFAIYPPRRLLYYTQYAN